MVSNLVLYLPGLTILQDSQNNSGITHKRVRILRFEDIPSSFLENFLLVKMDIT
jgi:hypothetical protein